MPDLPNPLELIQKLLPPLPFSEVGAAAGPPNPLELIQKLLPPLPFSEVGAALPELPLPRTEVFGAGAVSTKDEEVEVF